MENEKNLIEPNLDVDNKKEIVKTPAKSAKNDDKANTNLELYNQGKEVPESAKKPITGGKLTGFTDINPMWRIKRLTEMFGPCGKGWKASIVEKWVDNGANGEIIANVKINLYYKIKNSNTWEDPIEGIGGSMLITTEKGKLTSNDEAYKMAYTDAISVACKMIGIGADVYFEKDRTKYDAEGDGTTLAKNQKTQPTKNANQNNKTKYQIVKDLINGTSIKFSDIEDWLMAKVGTKRVNEVGDDIFNTMINSIKARITKEKNDNKTPWEE